MIMTQGKIQKLERQLGFASQRGLQRGGGNHSDDVKSLLDGIDYIKKAYVDVAPRELRESDKFEDHCRDLLWTIGPRLWPGVEDQQSQTEYLDDLYPRVLDFTVAVDRERLVAYSQPQAVASY